MTALSVVIPVLNGQHVIGRQLEALAQQVASIAWEVVVADNGSTDQTRNVVQGLIPTYPVHLAVVDASTRPGASHARNVGALQASGEVLAFVDSDDLVAPGWVQAAWDTCQEADLAAGLLFVMGSAPHEPAINPEGLVPGKRHPFVMSGNFAIRRDRFIAVRGFDEGLPPYGCEDMEFSMRAADHGLHLAGATDMVVHFQPTTSWRSTIRKVFLSGKAEAYVWDRHPERFEPVTLRSTGRGLLGEVWRTPIRLIQREPLRAVARPLVQSAGRLAAAWSWRLRGGERVQVLIDGTPHASRSTLWVVPVSNLAGVARHVLDAAKQGIHGYTLTVAAPEGPLLDSLRAMDIPVHPVGLDAQPAAAVRDLRAVIKTVRPAVVHSHLAKADFLVAAASLGLPCKVVSTEHGIAADAQLYNQGRLKAGIRKALHRLRSRRFDALIAVSESTRREMIRAWRPRTPINVILNGVDRPSDPRREPGTRFLSLARLAPEKRIAEAIRAFAAVAVDLPDATLTIAGDGPERDALGALVEQLGVGDRITFPGHLDAEQALQTHDVLVQLSAWENASYAILDAVVHGLGVVATPVGGNPEILPPQCLSPADDHSRLAQLLREQAGDVTRRPELSEAWPTVEAMTSQIAALYERIV